MEPRCYNAEGQIDYDSLRVYSALLRQEAIEEFWSAIVRALQHLFSRVRRSAAAHPPISANANLGDVT